MQNTHLAFEPAMRGWMEDRPSYIPPVAIGEVMRGMTVGQVLESNLEGYEPGDRVTGMTGWQEFAVGDRGLGKLPDGVAPEMALSLFGATGITAYFGLLDIGEPKEGETVVLCGGISHYNDEGGARGPKNYFNLVLQRGRMEGFIVMDYLPRWGEAIAQLGAWAAEGQLAWRVDVQQGFENAPRTFLRLFEGANVGKQLLKF